VTELCGWNCEAAGCDLNEQLQNVEAEFDFSCLHGERCRLVMTAGVALISRFLFSKIIFLKLAPYGTAGRRFRTDGFANFKVT